MSVGRNHPFGAIGTPDAPRRTGFGSAGVLEVVEDHRGDTYRAVYTVKFAAPQRATQSAAKGKGGATQSEIENITDISRHTIRVIVSPGGKPTWQRPTSSSRRRCSPRRAFW